MQDYAPIVSAGLSLLGSIIVALVAWGWRAEIGTLRAEMALASAKIETVRVEVRASIAEAVNEFYIRVNGSYVKKDVCKIAMGSVEDRIVQIRESVDE